MSRLADPELRARCWPFAEASIIFPAYPVDFTFCLGGRCSPHFIPLGECGGRGDLHERWDFLETR
jgi:hypothetical protein